MKTIRKCSIEDSTSTFEISGKVENSEVAFSYPLVNSIHQLESECSKSEHLETERKLGSDRSPNVLETRRQLSEYDGMPNKTEV